MSLQKKIEEQLTKLAGLKVCSNSGRLLTVLAAILWSLAGVFIKSLALPAITIAFYRFVFAGLFFLVFLKAQDREFNRNVFFSVLTFIAATGSFVWANKLTTAANAVVLQYTAPVYVYALVPVLFREKIKRFELFALCGGMIGIGIIFLGSVERPDMPGVLIALFSGLLFSLYMVNLRFLLGMSMVFIVFLNNLGGAILFFPFVINDLYISLSELIALMIMGVVQFGAPYFIFSKALKTISLQEASLILLLEPVLNPLWVYLVIGELPARVTLIGGSVILISLAGRYLTVRSVEGRA